MTSTLAGSTLNITVAFRLATFDIIPPALSRAPITRLNVLSVYDINDDATVIAPVFVFNENRDLLFVDMRK